MTQPAERMATVPSTKITSTFGVGCEAPAIHTAHEHRPEQQPDADGAMQARDFDEIANAARIAQVGQPRVRRRRGEIQVGEGLVSHWRASYTRAGVS